MIKKCDCKSKYQDKRYGKGNRVHNELSRKQSASIEYRCTVCGRVK